MGMALEATGISPRAKVILIAISNCANEYTFEGYPGRKDLARIADCSLDTIDRCIRELGDAGYLEKTERPHDKGGLTSNLYRVFPQHDPSRKSAATPSRESAEGGERIPAARVNAEVRLPSPQADAATLAARGAATKEPLSEPLVVVVSAPVSRERIDGLVDRLGAKANVSAGELRHGAILNQLLRGGCDWFEDIEPAADALAASWNRRDGINSWVLIQERALRLRDVRLSGVRPPEAVSQPQPRQTSSRRPSMATVVSRMRAEGKLT